MDTYGDLVTLLLCFFVLLFAMSTVEEVKYQAFAEALSSRFGSPTDTILPGGSDPSVSGIGEETPTGTEMDPDQTLPQEMTQLEEAITKYIEENNMEGQVSVESGQSGAVFIRLSNNLLFDGDSYDLRAQSIDFLNFLSQCFIEVDSEIMQVKMNGHTASIQGSGTDDWLLSAQRAGIVTSYIQKDGGYDRFKLYFSGYGRNYPIADNGTDDGRAANRRVDIVVLGNDSNNLTLTLQDAMRIYFPGDATQFFEGEQGELPDDIVDNISPNAAISDALAGLTPEELEALHNGASG